MLSIVLLSVVLGLSCAAPQGFPLESHSVQTARNEFIREYNRLAALAAAAPDINIIMASHRIDNPAHNTVNTQFIRPKAPVHHVAPAFNKYAFSANLGGNHQFIPQANTFPVAPVHHHSAGHLAGHQAGHRFVPTNTGPIAKWTGPFADTVPAGVNGLPRQVGDTPAVLAAKAAHFAALNAAYQAVPRQTHF